MTTLRLRGGRVIIDPTQAEPDAVRDLFVRDGRIAEANDDDAAEQEIDAGGCIVMAGGIDMHTHIGGGKVNLARLLMTEDHRNGGNPIALPNNPLELASCGTCAPGTLATGYRYVEMGYTAAFEPAMVASNARHAHMEMGDTPILDHGAYVMLGNDELFLQLLHEGGAAGKNFAQIRDYVAWTINATKALGVKVVNPGGISAFKFNQRKLDVDEQHVHWQVTPRRVVHTLARALKELGVPHPLHIHGSNLGVAGNIASTLETIAALEGLPAHLTHVQFHAYGNEGPKKFSSAALQLAEAVNANPQISIDIGQVIFGQTVTASGDTMRQHANAVAGQPAQVDRRRHRARRRLRRGAVSLPRAELCERAAMGDRARVVPARRQPVAGGADHGPSQRRAVHQLPASDPPADGPQLPRGADREIASGRGGELRAAFDHARADACMRLQ